MERVTLFPSEILVNGWIDPKYLPKGKDKYYIRNRQVQAPEGGWRHLTSDEIERLVKNSNTASSWDTVWVTDNFNPDMLLNNRFYGTVRIGRVIDAGLQYHDLRLPVGITNSSIHSCDIGDDCAIHDVHYLSHYIIGGKCMLFNINEMSCTDHAKFGNGIIKEGEEEKVRVVLDIMNEAGCRGVYPFNGMIAADAYMWGKYIDDADLQKRLREITQRHIDNHRGYYGEVGEGCVIKNSSIIKDANIGSCCYIKGASKLKNITINSSDKEPSQIGEGVILVNGIVGYGCRIFYNCTAVKFVIGNNSNLKYGARMLNSVLGDNSTISCCEVLNNLIFAAHEQHHNNSFLIASTVMGQSNMAAGATVGSNHNSRSNDNEIVAGRGFWPGLCSSVKHSSRFASFTLLAKGAYMFEMDIKLPFSLVYDDPKEGRLMVKPAFWWTDNMYALCRNNWKFQHRDARVTKVQNIEFDTFAPDSMEEAIKARKLLEAWSAGNWDAEVLGEGMEKSHRKVCIVNARKAYEAYGDMLVHYAVTNVLAYLESNPGVTIESLVSTLDAGPEEEWINLGGQLMKSSDFDSLRADIRSGKLDNWESIHKRYDEIWARYPMDKLRHGYRALCGLYNVDRLSISDWADALEREIQNQKFIREQVRATRRKDYENPFRKTTYRSDAEMKAALGTLEENSFVKQNDVETEKNIKKLQTLARNLK